MSENDKALTKSPLENMYQTYFLDYASYVILERAIPAIDDGLKPVQRRILHSMRRMHDGRFHKVANIIGHSMQFHPHGDAAIGSALVNLGQKNLLIETQGNWGDVRTGDSAAAPRYIEARLSSFALDILFNPDTTEWQMSYDGRNKEPIFLPAKFPIVLSQGAEGIAVGLSTKLLPHNFNEIIKACIQALKGRNKKIYPDFDTGGYIDVTDYNDGQRGGKVKVRAKIEKLNKKQLAITELPYGITSTQLIDSILKANDKGKIKIKNITDNTAKDVEILIELANGISPDVTMDALYAFTYCEISISPNACVIVDNKPMFITISEIIQQSSAQTKDLLKWELTLKRDELLEKWHFASLEKIFIGERIYRDIEEAESWDEVLERVEKGLHLYCKTPANPKPKKKLIELNRNISVEDITKLTEIKIRRISKYNIDKAEALIEALVEELKEVNHHLAHITDFTIAFFENLLTKYGKPHTRKTEIREFTKIEVQQVVINNTKLYVDRAEGFVGNGLKKAEFVQDCSDLDDVIAFTKNGILTVTRIAEKTFIGKDIIHAAIWHKNDERTTYNLIYQDPVSGRAYAKRFHVSSITRDKAYNVIGKTKGKILYFSTNPNGEAEVVEIKLPKGSKARNKKFEFDFAELAIKGRNSKGNIASKYPVLAVKKLRDGETTLSNIKFWMNKKTMRLTTVETDTYVGSFETDDLCIAIYTDGSYELFKPEENRKLDLDKLIKLDKYNGAETIISTIYYETSKKWSMVKRFQIETSSEDQRFSFIGDNPGNTMLYVSTAKKPVVQYAYGSGSKRITDILKIAEFIDVKGWKTLGNKLVDKKVTIIKDLTKKSEKVSVGDTIELDVQTKLFD